MPVSATGPWETPMRGCASLIKTTTLEKFPHAALAEATGLIFAASQSKSLAALPEIESRKISM